MRHNVCFCFSRLLGAGYPMTAQFFSFTRFHLHQSYFFLNQAWARQHGPDHVFSISSRGSLFLFLFYQDKMGSSWPVIVFSFSRCSWWLSLVSFSLPGFWLLTESLFNQKYTPDGLRWCLFQTQVFCWLCGPLNEKYTYAYSRVARVTLSIKLHDYAFSAMVTLGEIFH